MMPYMCRDLSQRELLQQNHHLLCRLQWTLFPRKAGPRLQPAGPALRSAGPALQSVGLVSQSVGPVLQSVGPVLQSEEAA